MRHLIWLAPPALILIVVGVRGVQRVATAGRTGEHVPRTSEPPADLAPEPVAGREAVSSADEQWFEGLDEGDEEVRLAAVANLQFASGRDARERLIRALADPSPCVRAAAAYALANDPQGERAAAALIRRLGVEPDPDTQGAIIVALGRVQEASATSALLDVLGDPRRETLWKEAAEALSGASPALLPRMEERLAALRSRPCDSSAAAAAALEASIAIVREGPSLDRVETPEPLRD